MDQRTCCPARVCSQDRMGPTPRPDDRFIVNTYDGTTGGISRALEAKADLQAVDYNAIGLDDKVKAPRADKAAREDKAPSDDAK